MVLLQKIWLRAVMKDREVTALETGWCSVRESVSLAKVYCLGVLEG